jgi:hypothetical protein
LGRDAVEEDTRPAFNWSKDAACEGGEQVLADLLDSALREVTAKYVHKVVGVGGPAAEDKGDARFGFSERELNLGDDLVRRGAGFFRFGWKGGALHRDFGAFGLVLLTGIGRGDRL